MTENKVNIIMDSQILSTLMSCPRLTDFRFNLDLVSQSGKNPSLEKGSIIHAIMEHYFKAMKVVSRKDSIQEGLNAGREYLSPYSESNKYIKEINHLGVNNLSQEDIDLVFDTAAQYFEYYKDRDYWTPIDVEHVHQAVIYEDDEVRIMWKAKYDLIADTSQGVKPVDHKTMSQRRDTLSLNNQFMGQCLLAKSRDMIINKIGFQKSLKPSEKFTRPVISYTADQLIEWSQIIVPFYAKQMIAFNNIGYWPPNFTHCENKYGYCAFIEVCKSNPSIREETIRLNFIKGKKWDVTNDE